MSAADTKQPLIPAPLTVSGESGDAKGRVDADSPPLQIVPNTPTSPAYYPPPVTPLSASAPSITGATLHQLRSLWLSRNLPVIMQPEIDITNHNSRARA
jgi:hypothetical protein